jgi:hypothetical protein
LKRDGSWNNICRIIKNGCNDRQRHWHREEEKHPLLNWNMSQEWGREIYINGIQMKELVSMFQFGNLAKEM